MIEYFKIYLPKTKREVKIEVSIPRNYQRTNTKFDTMYLLDGQNALKIPTPHSTVQLEHQNIWALLQQQPAKRQLV